MKNKDGKQKLKRKNEKLNIKTDFSLISRVFILSNKKSTKEAGCYIGLNSLGWLPPPKPYTRVLRFITPNSKPATEISWPFLIRTKTHGTIATTTPFFNNIAKMKLFHNKFIDKNLLPITSAS